MSAATLSLRPTRRWRPFPCAAEETGRESAELANDVAIDGCELTSIYVRCQRASGLRRRNTSGATAEPTRSREAVTEQ